MRSGSWAAPSWPTTRPRTTASRSASPRQAPTLARLPGVVARARRCQTMKPDNVHGVPLIGAPAGLGRLARLPRRGHQGRHHRHRHRLHARRTSAARARSPRTDAHATDTAPPTRRCFGPRAPRVKGGIDFVGDDYNADPNDPALPAGPAPGPEPARLQRPRHARRRHGGRLAACSRTAAPTPARTTPTRSASHSVDDRPGRRAEGRPLRASASSAAQGSTDVIVDAIEWAVDNDMDVINMSLGSPFGSHGRPGAVAVDNAAKAGVDRRRLGRQRGPEPVHDRLAGHGRRRDLASRRATRQPTLPGARRSRSPASTDHRRSTPTAPVHRPDHADRQGAHGQPGARRIATSRSAARRPSTRRASRGRHDRGRRSAAPAPASRRRSSASRPARLRSLMVNNATGFPPFEGPITRTRTTATPYTVTIPFLGRRRRQPAAAASVAQLDGRPAHGDRSPTSLTNPDFPGFASFSSGGPRGGDSGLKPDVTAPGVSHRLDGDRHRQRCGDDHSGTSMASPHTAGVAALVRQAHPNWKSSEIKAAIVNTGDPRSRTGVADAVTASAAAAPGSSSRLRPTKTQARRVLQRRTSSASSLSFGYAELEGDFTKTKTIKLRNLGTPAATFNVPQAMPAGSPHTVALRRDVRHGSRRVATHRRRHAERPGRDGGPRAAGRLPARSRGWSRSRRPAARQQRHRRCACRTTSSRVPWRTSRRSSGGKLKPSNPTATANVTNKTVSIAGDARLLRVGPLGRQGQPARRPTTSARSACSRSRSGRRDPSRRLLVFAVNTYDRWSNASTNEFDIFVDVNNDGMDDYVVVGRRPGGRPDRHVQRPSWARSCSAPEARVRASTSSRRRRRTARRRTCPCSPRQLCRAGEPCLNAANPRISYHAAGFDSERRRSDEVDGTAKYNPWHAITTGGFATVAPGGTARRRSPSTRPSGRCACSRPDGRVSRQQGPERERRR